LFGVTASAADREQLTVAVLRFSATVENKELVGLDLALSEMLITDLSRVRELQIVERERLAEVSRELKLPAEGFIDPKTAAAVGKGVGAKAILTGSFFAMDTQIRVDARLIHVETGKVLVAEAISGSTKDPFDLEKQLQQKIIESLGIKLSKLEEADLAVKPTNNAQAAAAYGRAEALRDSGDLAAAKKEVAGALTLDPEFALARELGARIDSVLEELEGERYKALIEKAASFEMSLYDWPSSTRLDYNLQIFPVEEYDAACKKGEMKQALFLWVSSLAARNSGQDFYGVVFNEPGERGLTDDNTEMGAHTINLFWCDVFSSDPYYTPSKPVTRDDQNDPMFSTTKERYKARCYRNYEYVLDVRWLALLRLGDLKGATASAETSMKLYKGVYPGEATRGEQRLREISEISKDPKVFQELRTMREIDSQRWRIAEERIVTSLAEKQQELLRLVRSDLPDEKQKHALAALGADAASKRFAIMGGDQILKKYATELEEQALSRNPLDTRSFVDVAEEVRDRMIEEAKGKPFLLVERFAAKDEPKWQMVHVAGCPFARDPMPAARARVAVFGEEGLVGPKYQGATDVCDAIQKKALVCSECTPIRWAEREPLIKLLREEIPVALATVRKHEKDEKEPWKEKEWRASAEARLVDLLRCSATVADADVHQHVRGIVSSMALTCRRERELQRSAVLALGRSADAQDVELLQKVLVGSATPDVRLCAAVTLAGIGGDGPSKILAKAEASEQYYFVRHWIAAARQISANSTAASRPGGK
jgi:TolB-like protein